MREVFVTELVKEVLGPRYGINEVLNDSPLSEYITGVLSPHFDRSSRDADSDSEVPQNETREFEDETVETEVGVPPMMSPPLDPKNRPSSMGLSFMVRSRNQPSLQICLSWARYRKLSDHSWERVPRICIRRVTLSAERVRFYFNAACADVPREEAEISVVLIKRPRSNRDNLVSIFLTNEVHAAEDQFNNPEPYVFQPQIRVVPEDGTTVLSGIENLPVGEEERTLEFLYRDRQVVARGHLCSAIWKEIDPERRFSQESRLDYQTSLQEPPFHWVDGELLTQDQRDLFSGPAVRTEFVPLYSIPSPDMAWPEKYGASPELEASRLAEAWDPDLLRRQLMPLADGFEQWLGELRGAASRLEGPDRTIAERRVDECARVLQRIRGGVDLLCADEDARLAFCFSNAALDLQSQWTRRVPLIWRPFQLAFILMTLSSTVDPRSPDRDVCDLLWVPTAAGKTEAYLAVAAFAMAYRRRRARRNGTPEDGVAIITRYTLRLLTIQQFRRTLAVVSACEFLRVQNHSTRNPVGWRPSSCINDENHLWGVVPFSIGLWVGGTVTPNRLDDMFARDSTGRRRLVPGALHILRQGGGQGEPAQVLNCPACNSILATAAMGLRPGRHKIHFVVRLSNADETRLEITRLQLQFGNLQLTAPPILTEHAFPGFATLTVEFESPNRVRETDIETLWRGIQGALRTVALECVRPARPGYFLRWFIQQNGKRKDYDFDVYCPNPACPLRRPWCGGAPSGSVHGRAASIAPEGENGYRWVDVQEAFRLGSDQVSDRIPILALIVDDQIYRRVPTLLIATVDKFARPPFEPRAASLFGNVGFHHCIYGYYRPHDDPNNEDSQTGHVKPLGPGARRNFVQVQSLPPPEIILQDELHLIEGPLGSLFGIYESAISFLCQEPGWNVKYLASTATVKRAEEQIQSVFTRRLQIFPPVGLTADDRFFIRGSEAHPLDDVPPGRLYLGICAPGRGPLTPLVRIWARLLQTAWEHRDNPSIDSYWTLTGYFNAVRELGGARALYRQDIPQRIRYIAGGNWRQIAERAEEKAQELSGRTVSTDLPAILELLDDRYPDAQDALFTTSMFGTGVDIQRIGLMVVNGQPKTTSSYIQSTGRVGRSRGALVVTFLRASRPRDLNHYEFFCGYHRQLHRFVEPVTVYPFAPGVLDRAAGPVSVFILRAMRGATVDWHNPGSAPEMAASRSTAQEVGIIPAVMEARSRAQPGARRPPVQTVADHIVQDLDHWQNVARRRTHLRYVEYSMDLGPRSDVVLGDEQHQGAAARQQGIEVVYENAPQSLRDIEETTGFET